MTKTINIYVDPMMAHTHNMLLLGPFSPIFAKIEKIVVMCPTIHQLNGPGGMNMYGHFNGIVPFFACFHCTSHIGTGDNHSTLI